MVNLKRQIPCCEVKIQYIASLGQNKCSCSDLLLTASKLNLAEEESLEVGGCLEPSWNDQNVKLTLEGKLAEPAWVLFPAQQDTCAQTSLPLYLCASVPICTTLYISVPLCTSVPPCTTVQLLNSLVMGVSPSLVVASLGLQVLEFI